MRYYFNLAGAVHDPDDEGVELADMGEARHQAVVSAAELIQDKPDLVWLGEELRVEVTNSDRLVLLTVIVFGVDSPALKDGNGPTLRQTPEAS